MHRYLFIFFFIYALSFHTFSQSPSVGLIYDSSMVSDGYTLFTPEDNHHVYLVNNCGEKVKEWTFSDNPALTCYLLENGNVLRAGKTKIEIRDWNDNLIWSFLKSNLDQRQHHDIEPLPNGNVLCLLFDRYSDSVMIQEGRDSSKLATTFRMDKIVEIKPIGLDSAVVVWEWKFMDHLIQDFDSTKANYGIVANHPELVDLNFDNNSNSDYTHCNSIDYNEKLDQIILSVRHLDEIMIIDHSTTTLQASGHTGGNSNRGGDILWRWGNPQVYRQGTSSDQQLFLQHDAKWIDSGFIDGGYISVFSNFGDSTSRYSEMQVIKPVISGSSYTKIGGKFAPLTPHFSWNGTVLGDTVLEIKKSGVQFLANGNFLICETTKGQFSEFTRAGAHVWTYKNPSGATVSSQFDTNAFNTVFRVQKYLTNYPGFIGRTLMPMGTIESTNSLTDSCKARFLSLTHIDSDKINLLNPAYNGVIRFDGEVSIDRVVVYDINGEMRMSVNDFKGISLKTNFKVGMYIVQLFHEQSVYSYKIVVTE